MPEEVLGGTATTQTYKKSVNSQLDELYELLTVELTDVANGAIDYGLKFRTDAKQTLGFMSKLASDLSVALIKLKENKTFTPEEDAQFEEIKKFAATLGNLQFKINRIIISVDQMNALARDISRQGLHLAEEVMVAQDELKFVRATMSSLNIEVNDESINYLLHHKEEKAEEQAKANADESNGNIT